MAQLTKPHTHLTRSLMHSCRNLAHACAAPSPARLARIYAFTAGSPRAQSGGSRQSSAGCALTGLPLSGALWLLSEAAVRADQSADFSQGGFAKESYYVTLGLFLLSLPGLWSQVKRAPKAKQARKVFEVDGPARMGAMALDDRARQLFVYFKTYNYEVKETGEVIRFVGNYKASRGQAAALVFYVFCGLASTALVLSIAVPFGGAKWYLLTALSPLAGVYYWQRGTRQEEIQVKMVTSDDETVTDITVLGADEELERLRRELDLREKGKVLVKGLLES